MTVLGDFAKGLLLTFVAFYVIGMLGNLFSGNMALFVFMLIGLLIPSLWLAYEYAVDKRKK